MYMMKDLKQQFFQENAAAPEEKISETKVEPKVCIFVLVLQQVRARLIIVSISSLYTSNSYTGQFLMS